MSNNRKKGTFLLVILTLIALNFACIRTAKSDTHPSGLEPIPVTTEAAIQLEDSIEAAASASLSGETFTLQLTEAQLTSTANIELQSVQDNPVKNIQIHLQDSQIKFSADFLQNGFTIPVSLTSYVFVNASGQIGYEIITANMGPFPIPEIILDQITGQLDQYILSELSPAATGVVITSIQIADGMLTIIGQQY